MSRWVVEMEVRGRATVIVETETEQGACDVARTMGEWDFDTLSITESEPVSAVMVDDAA